MPKSGKNNQFSDPVILDFMETNRTSLSDLSLNERCTKFLKEIEVFKTKLSQFDNIIIKEADKKLEETFFKLLDEFFFKANQFESDVKNPILIKNIKKVFLTLVQPFMKQSVFATQGYIKPKGYPGDFQIVEAMYNNITCSKNFGLLLDKYFLQNDYVQAVRDRKNIMKKLLKDFIVSNDKSHIKILNLACGSCREIRELFKEGFNTKKNIVLNLVDQEKGALDFANSEIGIYPSNWKIMFVQENILNFLNGGKSMEKCFQKQDFIYSIGLADYLPDSILGPIIKHSFEILEKEGELVIAHKNVREFISSISDWGADWKFIPRTSEEFLKLIETYLSEVEFNVKVFFESKRRLFFVTLRNSTQTDISK